MNARKKKSPNKKTAAARQDGYYKILRGKTWIVAEWYAGSWQIPGTEVAVHDDAYFTTIGERIDLPPSQTLEPGWYWVLPRGVKCVPEVVRFYYGTSSGQPLWERAGWDDPTDDHWIDRVGPRVEVPMSLEFKKP